MACDLKCVHVNVLSLHQPKCSQDENFLYAENSVGADYY